jgi:hypothetical protein
MTEQLTYAQIAERLNVSPEAARAIARMEGELAALRPKPMAWWRWLRTMG